MRRSSSSAHNPVAPGTTFVLGKGGVGKSVIAAGLASAAAKTGRRVLLVRLSEAVFDETAAAGPEPSDTNGVSILDLSPRRAMDEFVHSVVRVRALSDRIVRNEVYGKFFAAAPGLPDLVVLGRIREYSRERSRGEARWPFIVVDCPSSGHGILMLETPFAAFRAAPVGPFGRLANGIIEWLRNEARLVVVAVPEEMAVVEAVELRQELAAKTGLQLAAAILNRISGSALSKNARAEIHDAEAEPGSSDGLLVQCGLRAERRARREQFHRRRLANGLSLTPREVEEFADPSPQRIGAALENDA